MRWMIPLLIIAFIEWYAFQSFRVLVKSRWALWTYLGGHFLLYILFTYLFLQFDRHVGQTQQTLLTMGLLLLVALPKLVLCGSLILEDMGRLGVYVAQKLFLKNPVHFPERRKFVSQVALGLAAVPFLSLIYGMTKGKYAFKVFKYQLFFPDLPDAFDGFTLTQISDIHSGSFDNPDKIAYAIDLINQQPSDLFLFTGDIVNTHAHEMQPWIEAFRKIKAHSYGKFSVLGNHDYGEYAEWNSRQEKEDNFTAIKDLHHQVGFKLLLNEHVRLRKGTDEMVLMGVENWGVKFKKAGDLPKTIQGVTPDSFKILMSHDPSHWEVEVKNHPIDVQLTLSGHTHGLQFGIEIPGWIKWSPVQYLYKQWAGLYEHQGRVLNVNRGFGFHAYPGRVGIRPEITVIELKKSENRA